MILVVGAALVAALVLSQTHTRSVRVRIAAVAVAALVARVVAVAVIHIIATRTHREGVWLNDEASFWLATEALLPNPFEHPLPFGLGHLGGNGYLGLTTWLSIALGGPDAISFRLTNATLGTLVAVTSALIARRLFGSGAALTAGLAVAIWPTLVLWSATILRDTMGSLAIVALWWMFVRYEHISHPRVLAASALGLTLLAGVRPYVAGAVGCGLIAWAIFPWLAARSRRVLALGGVAVIAVAALGAVVAARPIDQAVHQLMYRQLTTRMETLSRLYYDVPEGAPPHEEPFVPGVPVARPEGAYGWQITGLIQQPTGPGTVLVAYTDGTVREERTADLTLLQSAPIVPLQLVAGVGPSLVAFVTGTGGSAESNTVAWIVDALGWDVLLVLGVIGGVRSRLPLRDWLFPACVVLGTILAIVAVPGAPGNDARHRDSHALPLLAVFAAGLTTSRRRREASSLVSERPLTMASSKPNNAPAPVASRIRSPR